MSLQLNMKLSKPIHFTFFQLSELNSIVYTCHISTIHSFTDGRLGWFRSLTVVSRAVVNVIEQASQWCDTGCLGCVPRRSVAGPYKSSTFHFMRNIHTDFHNSCTSFHPSERNKGPPSPYPHQHSLSLILLISDILT